MKKRINSKLLKFFISFLLITIAVTAPFYLAGCKKTEIDIATFSAIKGNIIETISSTGTVDYSEKKNYSLTQSAKVINSLLQGDSFKKGQVLIEIDNSKAELYVAQAEQNLELAKKSIELAKINRQSALDSNHIAIQLAKENNSLAEQASINAFKALENANILGSANIDSAYNAMQGAQNYLSQVKSSPFSTDIMIAQAEVNLSSAEKAYEQAKEGSRSQSGAAEGGYQQALINQSITYWSTLNSTEMAASQIKLMEKSIEQAEVQLELASINLELIRLELDNFKILAPFDGIVLASNFSEGETAGPGLVAISIMNNEFIIKSDINEVDIPKITTGQQVQISIDAYPETIFSGEVTEISPLSKNIAGIIVFEIKIKPEEQAINYLRHGFSVNLNIESFRLENIVYVPIQSVYEEDGIKYVDILTGENEITRTQVTTGSSNYDYIEIKSGISEGDMVVIPDF